MLRPFLSKPSVIRQDIYTSNSVIIIRLHETFPDRTFCNETTQDIQAGKVIGLGVVQLNVRFSQSLQGKDLGGWVGRSQCARKDFK